MTAGVVTVALAEVADVVRGVTFGKSDASDCALPNLMPVLRAGNIGRDLELDRNLVWVPAELVSPRQMLRFDDLVMCASSGSAAVVGKSAPIRRRDWKGTVGAFCFIVRSKSALCSAEFLAFVLRSSSFRNWAQRAAGANIKNIRKSELEEFPVPLPPLHEQRRIVGILNRAAKIERLRARAQERLREFIPALFVKMFGDPIENPKRWKVSALGDFCTLTQYGTSRKANDRSEGVPVLRMGNITYQGDLDCTDLKCVVLTENEFKKYALRHGDILFNRTNSRELVGKTGVWDGRFKAVAASYFIRLRLDETRVLPTFVWAFMNSAAMKHYLFTAARGAIGQANINAKELVSLSLPVPPFALQRRYEGIVEAARGTQSVAESGYSAASALNNSLMSRLLADSS